MELEEYKRSAYTTKARNIMEKINEKLTDPETLIDALVLIEENLDDISPIYLFITRDLSKLQDQRIKKRAEVLLEKYFEKPEYKKMSEKMDEILSYSEDEKLPKLQWPEIPIASNDSELDELHRKINEILQMLGKGNQIEEQKREYYKKLMEELEADANIAYA